MQGWVKLERSIMESAVWQDPHYLKLWMYCLMKASHKEHDQLVGNQLVQLKVGEFVIGRYSLTEDMNKGMKPAQKKNDSSWWRYLKNLEKWGMLHIKTNNKFSVVTVDKYSFFQHSSEESEQLSEQQMNNRCTADEHKQELKNVKNEKKNTSQKQVYDESSIHFQLSELLYKEILQNNPNNRKPNLQEWSKHIRLMMERDNRTEDQIKQVISFAVNDDFWSGNILSTKKLREKFDTLTMQMNKKKQPFFKQPNMTNVSGHTNNDDLAAQMARWEAEASGGM